MNQSVEKARVLIDLGRYDKAEELLGTVLAAEPDHAAAEAALRRALALDPENADAVQEMVYVDLAAGRRVTAKRRLHRLAALDHTRSPLVRSLLQAMRDEPVTPMRPVRPTLERAGPRHTWGWAAAVVGLIFVCRLIVTAVGSEPDEPRSRLPPVTTYRTPMDYHLPPTFPSRPAVPSFPPFPTYEWPRPATPR